MGFFSSESAARGSARGSHPVAAAVIDVNLRGKLDNFRAVLRLCLSKNETELYVSHVVLRGLVIAVTTEDGNQCIWTGQESI